MTAHVRVQRILWWNKFSRPEVTARSGTSIAFWLFDEATRPSTEPEE